MDKRSGGPKITKIMVATMQETRVWHGEIHKEYQVGQKSPKTSEEATTTAHITNQNKTQAVARCVQVVENWTTLTKYAGTWPEMGNKIGSKTYQEQLMMHTTLMMNYGRVQIMR